MVAVEVVEHHHVERRRGGASLLIPPDMQLGVIAAPIGQPMNEPRIAVEGEDNRPVLGEQRVELAVRQPVWVFVSGSSRIRSTTFTKRTRSLRRCSLESMQQPGPPGGDLTRAGQNHIRQCAEFIAVAGPLPDTSAASTVQARVLNR